MDTSTPFVRCRMFDSQKADFSDIECVVAVRHVVQANEYPLVLENDKGEKRYFWLLLIRLASGEAVRVEDAPHVRAALGFPEAVFMKTQYMRVADA